MRTLGRFGMGPDQVQAQMHQFQEKCQLIQGNLDPIKGLGDEIEYLTQHKTSQEHLEAQIIKIINRFKHVFNLKGPEITCALETALIDLIAG